MGAASDIAASQARVEEIRARLSLDVSPSADWTGAVSLTREAAMSSYLVRRLTGDTTLILAPGTPGAAGECVLQVAQDATGGRTLKIIDAQTPYGTPTALSAASNAVDIVHLQWTGESWIMTSLAMSIAIPTTWVVA